MATRHGVVLIDDIVDICRLVLYVERLVVDEILGRALHRYILRVAIHRAYIALHHLALIVREVVEWHTRSLGQSLGSIVGTQWCPVVVGAQVYILVGMALKGVVGIDSNDGGVELGVGIIYRLTLRLYPTFSLFGAVELDSRRDEHTVDRDTLAELTLIAICHLCIGIAGRRPSTIVGKRTYVGLSTHDDNAVVGNLSLLLGLRLRHSHTIALLLGTLLGLGL